MASRQTLTFSLEKMINATIYIGMRKQKKKKKVRHRCHVDSRDLCGLTCNWLLFCSSLCYLCLSARTGQNYTDYGLIFNDLAIFLKKKKPNTYST